MATNTLVDYAPNETASEDIAARLHAAGFTATHVRLAADDRVVYVHNPDAVFAKSSLGVLCDRLPPIPQHIADAALTHVRSLVTVAHQDRLRDAVDVAQSTWWPAIHRAVQLGYDRAIERRYHAAVNRLDVGQIIACGEEAQAFVHDVEARAERTRANLERLRSAKETV